MLTVSLRPMPPPAKAATLLTTSLLMILKRYHELLGWVTPAGVRTSCPLHENRLTPPPSSPARLPCIRLESIATEPHPGVSVPAGEPTGANSPMRFSPPPSPKDSLKTSLLW